MFFSDLELPSESEMMMFPCGYSASKPHRQSNRVSHYTKWTKDEDNLLKGAAERHAYDWPEVAKHFPGKTTACVRKRWDLKHNPSTIKTKWTPEEDELILKLKKELGGGFWKDMSKHMPGRPPDAIKNRYYSVLRRRISKNDPSQPLQNGHIATAPCESDRRSDPAISDESLFDLLSLAADSNTIQPALSLCSKEDKLQKVALLQNTLEVLHELLRKTKDEIAVLAEELNDNEDLVEAIPS